MADTNMGKFSESSSTNVKAPVANTPNTEGGFMSSAMDFLKKNKTIIIGVIVLIIIGFIAYKYFAKEGFNGATKVKAVGGKKKKAITNQQHQELNEDFDASEEEHFNEEFDNQEEDYQEEGQEDYEGAEEEVVENYEEFDNQEEAAEDYEGAEEAAEDYDEQEE